MSKLRVTPEGFRKINRIEGKTWLASLEAVENCEYDDIFYPQELSGEKCDIYKVGKPGDIFLPINDPPEGKVFTSDILMLMHNSRAWYTLLGGETVINNRGAINFGKLKEIPAKFTVKITNKEEE